jgi:hypothetical protein
MALLKLPHKSKARQRQSHDFFLKNGAKKFVFLACLLLAVYQA